MQGKSWKNVTYTAERQIHNVMWKIRKNEYLLAFSLLAVILFWNFMMVSKFWTLFVEYDIQQWTMFIRNYHMSGFDPVSYLVLTDWSLAYDIVRHPLLAYMMFPFYLLNQALWTVTGANCCQLIFAVILIFCAFYSLLFLYRILYEIVEIKQWQAYLLTVFFLAFAYILLATIVADHFCLSLLCIMTTIYKASLKIKEGRGFGMVESVLLFCVTSGVTLSNGVIVLIAVMVTNGRSFFRPAFLLKVAVIPSILMLGTGMLLFSSEKYTDKATGVTTQWRDVSQNVNRMDVVIENFFGESIQLHRKHLLGDVLVRRPVIVRYSWEEQYAVEAFVVCMLLVGMLMTYRKRLMQMMILILLFNIMLHVMLGFASKEVYIMACHWAFVIPVAMASLLHDIQRGNGKWCKLLSFCLCVAVIMITVYLYSYHSVLLYRYLTWPLTPLMK